MFSLYLQLLFSVFLRNERIVSRAIELNEQVQKFLARHDSLLSGRPTTIANHLECEEAEEGSYVSLRFIH